VCSYQGIQYVETKLAVDPGTRWITGYRARPIHTQRTITSFILHPEQLVCPKFVVPYGQPCLLRPPLTASFLGHSHGFSELVKSLREEWLLLFFYVLFRKIRYSTRDFRFAARQVHIGPAQRSAGLRRLSFKVRVALGTSRLD
jgi:hypothetical protein